MAATNPPRVVHLLDRSKPSLRGISTACCGWRGRQRYVTTMGWKVTCTDCNPPTRRKVRLKPRPAPVGTDLEMA